MKTHIYVSLFLQGPAGWLAQIFDFPNHGNAIVNTMGYVFPCTGVIDKCLLILAYTEWLPHVPSSAIWLFCSVSDQVCLYFFPKWHVSIGRLHCLIMVQPWVNSFSSWLSIFPFPPLFFIPAIISKPWQLPGTWSFCTELPFLWLSESGGGCCFISSWDIEGSLLASLKVMWKRFMCICACVLSLWVCVCSVVSDSLQPDGL